MAQTSAPTSPWFTSLLFPTMLCLAGLTAVLLDGLAPWRDLRRRGTWTQAKGRLTSAVERRSKLRNSAQGQTRMEYLVKRPQQKIFSKIVTHGWPLKRKSRVWIVRITYTYPWKSGRITKIGDSPAEVFDSEREAHDFLAKRLNKGTIRVWVNPKNPREATAFLGAGYSISFLIGNAMFSLGLLWLLVAFLLRRVHARQEGV